MQDVVHVITDAEDWGLETLTDWYGQHSVQLLAPSS